MSRFTLVLALLATVSKGHAAVSNYDRQILAAVLVLEAANQGEAGMLASLHVINNCAGGDLSRATHYCIHPPESWREQMVFTTKIGLHCFFREV